MADSLRRALDALTDGEPVDWLELQATAADGDQAARLADLQALEQMSVLLTGRAPGAALSVVTAAETDGYDPGSPARWGHVEIRGCLGRGAYGEVYDGWDTHLARPVALKLLPGESPASVIDEARRLARLRHPNVVTIFGADRHDGMPGLWMERLRGRALDELLAAQGAFSAREASALGIDVCAAVAAIHAAGLVHRDIKAQNVMREDGGRVVLMDLGTSVDLAQEDAPVSTLAGTPLYMAPELFEGATPGVATDVYALGVLLYRLVSRAFPVDARTIGEVRAAHASQRLRPLRELRADLPPRFVGVVERAMARDPKDRFASASDLERALRHVDEPAGGGPSRIRRTWLTAAVVLAFGAGAAAAWTWQTVRPATAASPAEVTALADDQYRLFTGYTELAFEKRESAPRDAYDAALLAFRLIGPILPGDEAAHAALSMQQAWLWRAAGDARHAREELDIASYQLKQSVGDDHPLSGLLAMLEAGTAQRASRHDDVARYLVRALYIRRAVLGLPRQAAIGRDFGSARLAGLSTFHSVETDTDEDGIVDLVETAVGLNPARADSDGDGLADSDEDHDGDRVPNRLALGVTGDPFLTFAHVGSYRPFAAMWQSRRQFDQGPVAGPPAGWSVATGNQGLILQRLPLGVRARAFRRGFSIFLRATPLAGVALASVDTSPYGRRFDVTLRPWSETEIESRLQDDVISQSGAADRHAWNPAAPSLFELRVGPGGEARLYRDGTMVRSGYAGHGQFQESIVTFGAVAPVGGQPRGAAIFHLLWLEVR